MSRRLPYLELSVSGRPVFFMLKEAYQKVTSLNS